MESRPQALLIWHLLFPKMGVPKISPAEIPPPPVIENGQFFTPNTWQKIAFLNPLDALIPEIARSPFAEFGSGSPPGPGVSLTRILGARQLSFSLAGGVQPEGCIEPPPPPLEVESLPTPCVRVERRCRMRAESPVPHNPTLSHVPVRSPFLRSMHRSPQPTPLLPPAQHQSGVIASLPDPGILEMNFHEQCIDEATAYMTLVEFYWMLGQRDQVWRDTTRLLLNNSASPGGGFGGGGLAPPPPLPSDPPPLRDWANFSPGLRPIKKFSLAPLAQVSLGQKISSALSQLRLLGGGSPPPPPPPPAPLDPPPLKRNSGHDMRPILFECPV